MDTATQTKLPLIDPLPIASRRLSRRREYLKRLGAIPSVLRRGQEIIDARVDDVTDMLDTMNVERVHEYIGIVRATPTNGSRHAPRHLATVSCASRSRRSISPGEILAAQARAEKSAKNLSLGALKSVQKHLRGCDDMRAPLNADGLATIRNMKHR